MNKINELFFTKFNNTSDARSVKEKRKKNGTTPFGKRRTRIRICSGPKKLFKFLKKNIHIEADSVAI